MDSHWNLLSTCLASDSASPAATPQPLTLFPAVAATDGQLQLCDAAKSVLAELCIHASTDGTHGLSRPITHADTPPAIAESVLKNLLLAAVEVAQRSRASAIRALIMPDDQLSAVWRQILLTSGFRHLATATIMQQQLSAAELLPAAAAAHSISSTSAAELEQDAALCRQLLKLLEQIALCSDDLSMLAAFEPVQLLRDWIESAATVQLSRMEVADAQTILTGVCASTSDTNAAASDRAMAPNLLYLGVHPAYRRRKIATSLLHACAATLTANGICWLQVAVDTKNEPALKLYRSAGLTTLCLQQILIHTLDQA